jgi:hypothetical protein
VKNAIILVTSLLKPIFPLFLDLKAGNVVGNAISRKKIGLKIPLKPLIYLVVVPTGLEPVLPT